ncbi:MAG: DNA gyrase inhibitor YacG [Neomegalonema sp.]|nr:DNA gyrase inhibitor YacG [Neomegalonema sp.]
MPDPTCPICGARRDPHFRPFCSKHCADIDLGRWMLGRYAVAAVEEDDPDRADLAPRSDEDAGP